MRTILAILTVLLSAALGGCGGGGDSGPVACRGTMANPDLCLTTAAAAAVSVETAASIKFISANTTNIALKGTGGFGRQEYSILEFKVLDNAGKEVAGTIVDFVFSDSNTAQTVGGLTLTPTFATSTDDGGVTTLVSAGTIPTSIRVVATIRGGFPSITSLSNILAVSTGVPDQNHFSLATETGNCEGRDVDQTCSIIAATLGDHFGNPAPDGTAVNFTTEGGVIDASCVTGSLPSTGATPSGQTTNSKVGPGSGTCSALLRASNPRPANGRVTVLAYAVGEENFIDANGNNVYDTGETFTDANGNNAYDIGESFIDTNGNNVYDGSETFTDKRPDIFRDDNETGVWNPGEPCIGPNELDINGVKTCSTLGDGKYNGVLRTPQLPSAKTLYVSNQLVQIFSGSRAVVSFDPPALVCPAGGTVIAQMHVTDEIGNIMPAGTTIDFNAVFGTVSGTVSPASIRVSNVVLAVGPPLTIPSTSYSVTVGCPTPAASGQLFVTVTSPTTATITRDSAPIN